MTKTLVPEQVKLLKRWIEERESIRIKKEAGAPAPWTKDVILRDYRFCNVHREDDAVTKWIARNWRSPFSENPDLWFWMLIARLINLPESLVHLPVPSTKWDPERYFLKPLFARRNSGKKIFNAAYIVSTNGHAMDKLEYVCEHILKPAWERRRIVRPQGGDTLATFASRLRAHLNGVAGFMAGQVVADMKYVGPLRQARDWATFAISGPGSRRGLNRICGISVEKAWKEEEWHDVLLELRDTLLQEQSLDIEYRPGEVPGASVLHAQDLQNCLCEFDKWSRSHTGMGRPKQLYRKGA